MTDFNNDKIQVFDSDANYITEVGSFGLGEEKFALPCLAFLSGYL